VADGAVWNRFRRSLAAARGDLQVVSDYVFLVARG
jgi:hypothetical protein